MSRYIYSLNDYHAIKRAEIQIDGITVLAGKNGSGKSTLAKWLYYIVNGTANFDAYVFDDYINGLMGIVDDLRKVNGDIVRGMSNYSSSLNIFVKAIHELLRLKDSDNIEKVEIAFAVFKQVLDKFCESFEKFVSQNPSLGVKDRLLNFFGIDTSGDIDDMQALDRLRNKVFSHAEKLLNGYYSMKENRNQDDFFALLVREYGIDYNIPQNIQLEEDDVKLFQDGKVNILLNLEKAIYIDSPMAVANGSLYDGRNNEWSRLQEMMLKERGNVKKNGVVGELLFYIKNLLGGEVAVKKDELNRKELHYVRKDGLNIRLDEVATGFKAFSYIQRLLENGHLDKRTLLLIDEPEAHLHPQWIVEFARLLVRLNKKLGVKVMLASHNPDMVAAIRAIAEKEEVLHVTRFYLAQPAEQLFTFEYKSLGTDIEEIFASFNIAYQRIEEYGTSV